MSNNLNDKTSLITNNKIWMESNATEQLKCFSELKGVKKIVGLPDLHAGRTPVGAAIETEEIIYPHIIGSDIGCGMTMFNTGVEVSQYKQGKWVKKLNQLETASGFGSIGGGNHFAEFQVLDQVFDQDNFDKLGIGKKAVMLLVHTGSRNYGQEIFSQFGGAEGIEVGSEQFENYLEKHDDAVRWAKLNRKVVAEKLIKQLGFLKEPIDMIDCCHNYVEKCNEVWIHRKGAVSTRNGMVVIPGSRGSLTYIVMPFQDCSISLNSISHGSGRKYQRSECRGRMSSKYTKNELRETVLKSKIICNNSNLLYEEAPDAYKNIGDIIKCLEEFNLIKIVASLKPLITYKG
ncbi:RNA ligase RtcB family protein [Aminipila sp.]|uniref:RNA ligase RtcB family protein n=1 Tax=Aminipila sp. TaxID=2060095 RepID=UPI00289B5F3A|nr:RNA ligase RtcB family protein [Aminipila sp.]